MEYQPLLHTFIYLHKRARTWGHPSWFCPLLAQTGSILVDQYRVFTVFVTVSYKGQGSNIWFFCCKYVNTYGESLWFGDFGNTLKGLKIPRTKNQKCSEHTCWMTLSDLWRLNWTRDVLRSLSWCSICRCFHLPRPFWSPWILSSSFPGSKWWSTENC